MVELGVQKLTTKPNESLYDLKPEELAPVLTLPIKFSFKRLEDLLPNSSSLPLYDEPVYDAYDDDMFDGVLDLEQLTYDNYDKSKTNVRLELFAHHVPKVIEKVEVVSLKAMEVNGKIKCASRRHIDLYFWEAKDQTSLFPCIFDHEATRIVKSVDESVIELKVGVPSKDAKLITKPINLFERTLKETPLILNAFTIISITFAYATLESLKIGRQIDNEWIYPDRFSQPNSPPYCVQPSIFLQA